MAQAAKTAAAGNSMATTVASMIGFLEPVRFDNHNVPIMFHAVKKNNSPFVLIIINRGWIPAAGAAKGGLAPGLFPAQIHMGSTDIPVPQRAFSARFQFPRGINRKEFYHGGTHRLHAPAD